MRHVCKSKLFAGPFAILLAAASLSSGGCAAEGGSEGEQDKVGNQQAPFILYNGAEGYLVSRVTSNIVVCLQGSNVTDTSRATHETTIRNAIMAWVEAIRPSSTATLLQGDAVTFGCTDQHVTIDWSADNGRAVAGQGFGNLFVNDGFNVVLHEFGHIFGIGDTYVEGVWTCHPGQENSVMCGNGGIPNVLTRDDINAIQEVYAIFDPTTSTRRFFSGHAWCNRSFERLLSGDFNADGKRDLLCHNSSTGHLAIDDADSAGRLHGTDWSRDAGWCVGDNQRIYVGDYNNDARDDLLCHDISTGHFWIDYSDAAAEFNGTDWERDANWCVLLPTTNPQLKVGDFNGDGLDDLLCFDASGGYFSIDHANNAGQFEGTDWERDASWCTNPTEASLLVNDYNGDGRDDLLCHGRTTGYKTIDYADASGQFNGTDWEADLNWCSASTGQLHTEDFNGDGRADLLCHDTSSGHKWIAFAQAGGDFLGTSRDWPMQFCLGNLLVPGDYDGNGSADFLCHGYFNGNKWVAYQFQ